MLFGQTDCWIWCGVKWPRDPISNVRKETERPRSSWSPTSWRYSGFPDFLLLAACRASWVLVGIMSSKRLMDKSSIRTMVWSCLVDQSINQSFNQSFNQLIFISGCTVGGRTYRVGESYTAEDGCNTWCVPCS